MPIAPIYQAAYYALYAIGSVSVGYLVLRAGNMLPQENTAKIAASAAVGGIIAVAAALVDYLLSPTIIGVDGFYPIILLAFAVAAGVLIKATGAKEMPRETLIETKSSLPQEKQEGKEMSVDEIIKQADLKKETSRVAQKSKEMSVDDILKEADKNKQEKEVFKKQEEQKKEVREYVEKVSINRGVERIESDMEKHERRLYAKKEEAKPQATQPRGEVLKEQKPFNEREELESLTKDLQEQAKKQKAQKEEKKEIPVSQAPKEKQPEKTSQTPASKGLFELSAPVEKASMPEKASSPQASKSLFDELSSIEKPAEGKPSVPAEKPFEKGVCPNCGAKTSRVVFCPHCGNGMCATCTSSITPTENGFEYVCPTCGEKISVKKKS